MSSLSKKIILSLSALFLVLIFSTNQTFAARTLNFTELGTLPEAAAQTTDQGKTLNSLAIFDGKLLASYGDYNANTGPITINPFDLTSQTFDGSAISVPAESIGTWRVINGKIYATTIDPTCSGSCPAGYVVYTPGSGWEVKTPVNAEHMYDIATLDGTDLWLFGGDQSTAYAWRSTDDGATWSIAQTHNLNPENGDDSERYYWGAALDGKMYMQSDVYNTANEAQIFDGTNWTTGTTDAICGTGDSSRGPGPVEFNDKLICPNYGEQVHPYNGQTSDDYNLLHNTDCSPSTHCYSGWQKPYVFTASDKLYLLNSGYSGNQESEYHSSLIFSNNLEDWQQYNGLPLTASSAAIDEQAGKLYVGTSDSKIYVADIPGPDITPPTVNLTSPTDGSTFNTSVLQVTADASDSESGVSKVEFYVNNELVSTDKTGPYSANWQNQYTSGSWQKPAGQYTFKAIAYDGEGNSTESSGATVTVNPPNLNISEYPTDGSNANVTVDDQGNLWYINLDLESGTTDSFFKFNPTTNQIETFPIPDGQTFSVSPFGEIMFSRGRIWSVDCDSNSIQAFIIITGQVESFPFDEVCQDGISTLAAQADGSIYSAVYGSSILNVVKADGSTAVLSPPAGYSGFLNLSSNSQGQVTAIVFSEEGGNTLGLASLNQSGEFEVYHSYQPGGEDEAPFTSMAITPDGSVWYNNPGGGDESSSVILTQIKPSGEQINYPNTFNSTVSSLMAGSDGALWFVLYNGQIGRISPGDTQPTYYAGLITPFPPGFAGMSEEDREDFNQNYLGLYAGNITVDDQGNLWLSDGLGQRLLKISLSELTDGGQNQNGGSITTDGSSSSSSSSNGSLAGLAATGDNLKLLFLVASLFLLGGLGLLAKKHLPRSKK